MTKPTRIQLETDEDALSQHVWEQLQASVEEVKAKYEGHYTVVKDKHGVKCERLTDAKKLGVDTALHCIKASGIVQGHIDVVRGYVADYSTRSSWDTTIGEQSTSRVLGEKDGKSIVLTRTITRPAGGGLISAREFVDLALCWKEGDEIWIVSCDADFKPFEDHPVKGVVRGSNNPCALIYTPIDETSTKVTFITHPHSIGGWVPNSVINTSLAGSISNTVQALMRHVEQNHS